MGHVWVVSKILTVYLFRVKALSGLRCLHLLFYILMLILSTVLFMHVTIVLLKQGLFSLCM
jgi:hypothetical protein